MTFCARLAAAASLVVCLTFPAAAQYTQRPYSQDGAYVGNLNSGQPTVDFRPLNTQPHDLDRSYREYLENQKLQIELQKMRIGAAANLHALLRRCCA